MSKNIQDKSEYEKLLKDYKKLEKRLDRITVQGDRQQRQVHDLNEKLNSYIELVDRNVIISTTDKNGNISSISEAFCEVSGYTKDELIGKSHNILKDCETPKKIYESLWKTILTGEVWRGELRNRKKNGDFYWIYTIITPKLDEDGGIIGYTAIIKDITDKKMIEEISITDGLTGLYNRRHFSNILPREIHRTKRDGKYLAFLFMDVDNFKKYNDTYGHQEGDNVLKQIGKVLKDSTHRGSDFAFRLGGEEFGLIFSDLNPEDALKFSDKIRSDIENLKIEHKKNVSKYVTASMGLIVLKNECINEDELYKLADDTLYLAKESGRNRVILGSI